MHRIKPGWLFLTGKPDEIDTLRRKLGFKDAKAKLDKDLTNHIGMVRYGNEARQWWAMFPGRANPPWIVESILWMDGPNAKETPNTGNAASKPPTNNQNRKDLHAGHNASDRRTKGRDSLKRKGGQK
jgi:hypothetical protein